MIQPFPVWVIHSPRLGARRAECLASLLALGWNARFVERPEAEDLGAWFWIRNVRNPRLTSGEISVYAKQQAALEAIAAAGEPSLVLEDDPVFGQDFEGRAAPYFAGLPKDWDFVFLGASCGLELPPDPKAPLFARAPATRSMSGYLVTPEAARKTAHALQTRKIRAPIDLTVNEVLIELGLRAYWSVPALIGNGSEMGRYPRSLSGGLLRRLNPARFFRS
ncbi:MAG: hypothetical protein K1Y01_11335 [Vicinamibacteria bacterium]|nr:hypothetical protein [Vicinamibacteria bacterium]